MRAPLTALALLLPSLAVAGSIAVPMEGCVPVSMLPTSLTWTSDVPLVVGQSADPMSGCNPTVFRFDGVLTVTDELDGLTTATLDPDLLPTCGRFQLDFEQIGVADSLKSLVVDTEQNCGSLASIDVPWVEMDAASPVPESTSGLLIGLGLVVLVLYRYIKWKRLFSTGRNWKRHPFTPWSGGRCQICGEERAGHPGEEGR